MASAWGGSWGKAFGNSWGVIGSVVPVTPPQVGDGRFWIKGKRPFSKLRYWWEKDPTRIPDVIPLVDLLEELEEEEQALDSFITELEYDGVADKILHVLHAYLEIIREQAEMKRESIKMQEEQVRVKKANRKKAIMLLLG